MRRTNNTFNENNLQNLYQYVYEELFAGKIEYKLKQSVGTCLKIKSCVGHNLLKKIIVLVVVL